MYLANERLYHESAILSPRGSEGRVRDCAPRWKGRGPGVFRVFGVY